MGRTAIAEVFFSTATTGNTLQLTPPPALLTSEQIRAHASCMMYRWKGRQIINVIRV